MQSITGAPSSYSIQIKVPLAEYVKSWTLLSAGLFLLWFFDGNGTAKPVIAGLGKNMSAAAVLLAAQLVLSMLLKPLVFHFNYETDVLTYARLALPWKRTISISQASCRLAKQQTHNGETHYLLLFRQGVQFLALQESSLWPLAKLQQIESCIQDIDNKKAR